MEASLNRLPTKEFSLIVDNLYIYIDLSCLLIHDIQKKSCLTRPSSMGEAVSVISVYPYRALREKYTLPHCEVHQ